MKPVLFGQNTKDSSIPIFFDHWDAVGQIMHPLVSQRIVQVPKIKNNHNRFLSQYAFPYLIHFG